MRFQTITKREFFLSLVITVTLGFLLMAGFIPSTKSLFAILRPRIPEAEAHWMLLKEMAFFPLLAAVLAISLPKRKSEIPTASLGHLYRISILPLLIAFVFGIFRHAPYEWKTPDGLVNLIWYVLFIPLGEEFLFRGWFYGVFDRIFLGKMLTETNPLPVALWMSALAFSIWHLQNLRSTPTTLVLFQVLYTFLTGIWLGYLRWKSAKIWPCIIAHFSINLASGVPV